MGALLLAQEAASRLCDAATDRPTLSGAMKVPSHPNRTYLSLRRTARQPCVASFQPQHQPDSHQVKRKPAPAVSPKLQQAPTSASVLKLQGNRVEVVETSGQLKRVYVVDDDSKGELRCLENTRQDGAAAGPASTLQKLRGNVRNFFLPAGFPQTVTPDYVPYLLWSFPTHVTGWAASVLVTSSMLRAVGIGASGAGSGAAAAAIKWVTKDGLGALGRLFVGGRFGSSFDEDPKRWRMYAEFIAFFGNVLELATPLAPTKFLLLASTGNLAKAVAKGLAHPSHRVIQYHFAVNNNVGDIAAKEEVWEVMAELVGLLCGVLMLNNINGPNAYAEVALAWTATTLVHSALRYQALSVVKFESFNLKRTTVLLRAHVAGERLKTPQATTDRDSILLPPSLVRPRVQLGCTLSELVSSQRGADLHSLLQLYEEENYLLSWRDGVAHVALKESADDTDVLRAMWQASWLDKHAPYDDINLPLPLPLVTTVAQNNHDNSERREQLAASLREMQRQFSKFMAEASAAGWDTSRVLFKPADVRIEVREQQQHRSLH
eukprot:jgi/Chlat1/6897/Chrsp52S06582